MKKLILAILSLSLISCMMLSVMASSSSTEIPTGLVAAFDFEGDTAEAQLADKANAGSVSDNLTANGTGVSIADGVATVVTDNGTSYLSFTGSNDLKGMTEYTLYMKVKQTGSATAWTSYIDAAGMIRWFIKSGSASSDIRVNCSASYMQGLGVVSDQWMYVAMSVKTTGEKIYLDRYYSTDGTNYGEPAHSEWTASVASFNVGKGTIAGGNGLTISYDDIMIFNRALNASEVQSLSALTLQAPASSSSSSATSTSETTTIARTTAPKRTAVTTTTVTVADTTAAETAADTTAAAEETKGCGATLGLGTVSVALISVGSAVCLKKRRKK